MANFCGKCGAPLIPGQPHVCPADQKGSAGGSYGGDFHDSYPGGGYSNPDPSNGGYAGHEPSGGGYSSADHFSPPYTHDPFAPTPNGGTADWKSLWVSLLNRMGVGDPQSNSDGVYERGQSIVPDNLSANANEKPIRQYTLAVLRSQLQFRRAEARLQVTNKRLLFRATGRSRRGKTTLQHEFDINRICGVEIHQDYRFNIIDLLICFLLIIVGAFIGAIIPGILRGNAIAQGLFALVACVAFLAPFFLLYRLFPVKVMSCAAALTCASTVRESPNEFFSGLSIPFVLVSFILLFIAVCLFCVKPNLIMTVKTLDDGAPIEIRSRNILTLGRPGRHTGFDEVLPGEDADHAIRELGALIRDVQELGDNAIPKWS